MTEQEILKFWEENKIFEKSLEKEAPEGDFVFYDGPPFATGLPHYGHILASIIKDAIPRYQTMKGKRVPRKWGWDCHGLPIENLVEKDLNLKSKKDIEEYGIEKFNKRAEESVLRYADEWKKIIPRIGRWVDMERDYRTMDWQYTESVWWVFKKLYEKGLVYEGHKPMHICPRCGTTLSNFEVTQAYKDIKDISVIAKFELEDECGTYVLAWTTTPWTLPGNAALAVNPDIDYVKVQARSEAEMSKVLGHYRVEDNNGIYILAKSRAEEVLKDKKYEILEEFKGKDLIGKKYKPLFDYYSKDEKLENRENGWKIYGADFVTTEDGTGVVHIAPAFGEDDMELGKKYGLPFIQHVGMDGKFKEEVSDFAGMPVKPKDNHQTADIEIIKFLAKEGKLFAKEKIEHSYPFCWRCDTSLLNYAASSWFVKVEDVKADIIANNKKINWTPAHLRDGRFGKWLEGARDWAISRSRYWGAPLPAWRCGDCGEIKPAGSVEDVKKFETKSGNKYFVIRHGEAENNVRGIVNSDINKNRWHLTEKGRMDAEAKAEILKGKKIDLIFSSDFTRVKETAEIAAEKIGVDKSKIIFDERLREFNVGVFEGKTPLEHHSYYSSELEKFEKSAPGGENLTELKNRVTGFLYDIDGKYKGKNILIVSHEHPIWLMFAGAKGLDSQGAIDIREGKDYFINCEEVMELDFAPLPHNENFVLDLHRPYIDKIEFACSCGGAMKRVEEVFDCWFESGSMPYGQAHYPFAFAEEEKFGFPAEFIAEGIDQTRGWFYTLLVLSTALFGKLAYKNVIANGIILAEDGQKMSKRLKNYPDPMEVVEKYGADALRYYLLSSPAVRAESLNFSEKGVDEANKKVISKIRNVLSFYKMYGEGVEPSFSPLGLAVGTKKIQIEAREEKEGSTLGLNILDRWIFVKLNILAGEITEAMDNYELDKAVRPIGEFLDDLSNWYVRRSRSRFKEEGEEKEIAASALRGILLEFSKLIAPFAPFVAEEIYWELKGEAGFRESVHLEDWPQTSRQPSVVSRQLLEDMEEVRRVVALGLEERAKAGVKVKQPLASLKIKNKKSNLKNKEGLLKLIMDEVNVKSVVFGEDIEGEVEIDTEISEELKQEGMVRELAREIQRLRKGAGLMPGDEAELAVEADEKGREFISKFAEEIKRAARLSAIDFAPAPDGEEVKIEDLNFKVKIKK